MGEWGGIHATKFLPVMNMFTASAGARSNSIEINSHKPAASKLKLPAPWPKPIGPTAATQATST